MDKIAAPRGATPVQYEDIERQLIKIFREILFQPIVDIILDINQQAENPHQLLNSPREDLSRALRTGKVQYASGVFSGKFTSSTSRAIMGVGGKWNKLKSVYTIDQGEVPNWITSDAAYYMVSARNANGKIQRELNEIQKNLDSTLRTARVNPSRMIDSANVGFRDVAKVLEVSPTITQDSKVKLAEDYSDNMELWIKKWCEEEIKDLRGRVEDNALEGYRFDKLIGMIQGRYHVSQNKAKFLARQETALFVSKFNEQRVKEAGVTSYIWSTSHDGRVRDSHKDLDKTIQFYDQPPIVDVRTGRRANPGEDFNCRCVPIPILRKPLVESK
jgi:SPP1 gp7 family putative phage head morphogenesis protein